MPGLLIRSVSPARFFTSSKDREFNLSERYCDHPRTSPLGRFLPVAILSPDRLFLGESGHWDASSKSHVYDIRERLLTAKSGQSTNEKNPARRPITHWVAGSTRRSLVYSAGNDLDNSGQDEGIGKSIFLRATGSTGAEEPGFLSGLNNIYSGLLSYRSYSGLRT